MGRRRIPGAERGADLGAHEQAGQEVRQALGLGPAHQARRTRGEHDVGQARVLGQPDAYPTLELSRPFLAEGHQPAQDAVPGQQAVELAGHVGLEAHDLACGAGPGPLGVGAGQHRAGEGREVGAPELRLLAAHDVVDAVVADAVQARDDVQRGAIGQRHRRQALRQVAHGSRARHVGRLAPALAAADHAAGDQRDLVLPEPVAADLAQRLLEAAVGHGHHPARRRAALDQAPALAEQAGAQVGGAPVEGDQSRDSGIRGGRRGRGGTGRPVRGDDAGGGAHATLPTARACGHSDSDGSAPRPGPSGTV